MLALTVLAKIPQIAILIGAVAVTLLSYNGQRLIAFAPRKTSAMPHLQIYETAP